MKRRTLALAVVGALALAACSSNKRRAPAAAGVGGPAAAANRRSGTSDPGSRYLDATGPVGGIAVETAPIRGGATGHPGPAAPPVALPVAPPAAPPVAPPHEPAQPGFLPAPELPPREQLPVPPTGGWR